MGRFFNEQIMCLKRIPSSKKMEEMRKEWNKSKEVTTQSPEATLKEKRQANLAKAREAKKQKRLANQ